MLGGLLVNEQLYQDALRLAEVKLVRVNPELLRQFLTYRMAERARLCRKYRERALATSTLLEWVQRYDREYNHDPYGWNVQETV